MKAKVTKWGSSLGVHVPASLAAQVGLKVGTEVSLVAEGGAIKLVPLGSPHRYTLDELLAGITKQNIHSVISTGPDMGREVLE